MILLFGIAYPFQFHRQIGSDALFRDIYSFVFLTSGGEKEGRSRLLSRRRSRDDNSAFQGCGLDGALIANPIDFSRFDGNLRHSSSIHSTWQAFTLTGRRANNKFNCFTINSNS
jgi:hypothetical protein